MDFMEIIRAIHAGKILEISSQRRYKTGPKAFLDSQPVNLSHAQRAIRNPSVKVTATGREWTAYGAAQQ